MMPLYFLCFSSSEAGCSLWNMLPRKAVDAPVLGDVQSQVKWGFGQPDLMGGKPSHGKGLEIDDF